MLYIPDRSMSLERTLAYFAIAIAVIALSALVMGKWSILLGVLWLAARIFSPNMMERAVGFALLVILVIGFAISQADLSSHAPAYQGFGSEAKYRCC